MEQYINFLFDEWPLSIALAFIIILIGRSYLEPMMSGIKTIKAQEAVRLMNDENSIVVDVRLEKEFKEGHILDSIHIPVGALESRIKELDKAKDHTVILNCQTGMRSKQGGAILKKHGFTNLYSIDGGMNAWTSANFPISKSTKKKK